MTSDFVTPLQTAKRIEDIATGRAAMLESLRLASAGAPNSVTFTGSFARGPQLPKIAFDRFTVQTNGAANPTPADLARLTALGTHVDSSDGRFVYVVVDHDAVYASRGVDMTNGQLAVVGLMLLFAVALFIAACVA